MTEMQRPQATLLPDGNRLHLHHGPIDLIVKAWGAGRTAAYARATDRFQTILQELVDELPALRTPLPEASAPDQDTSPAIVGPTAQRMVAATRPYAADFITPMAAVAGAVADEILAQITGDSGITKAYVNNGGDIAFHLSGQQAITTAIATTPPTTLTLTAGTRVRGIATSGWKGRSHSLGIADSVTVLAASAAAADAAATLIVNAVDLPGDPRIARQPARDLAPDSDLGQCLVTTQVNPLDPASRANALDSGAKRATDYASRGVIQAAYLTLQGDSRTVGAVPLLQTQPEPLDA